MKSAIVAKISGAGATPRGRVPGALGRAARISAAAAPAGVALEGAL